MARPKTTQIEPEQLRQRVHTLPAASSAISGERRPGPLAIVAPPPHRSFCRVALCFDKQSQGLELGLLFKLIVNVRMLSKYLEKIVACSGILYALPVRHL